MAVAGIEAERKPVVAAAAAAAAVVVQVERKETVQTTEKPALCCIVEVVAIGVEAGFGFGKNSECQMWTSKPGTGVEWMFSEPTTVRRRGSPERGSATGCYTDCSWYRSTAVRWIGKKGYSLRSNGRVIQRTLDETKGEPVGS